LLAADLLITELVADNDGSLRDDDGDVSDWVEIYNPTADPVSLLGWTLSDDAAEPTKWSFPVAWIDPGGYLVVFASGKDRAVDAFRLRRDFNSVSDGTFLVDLADGIYDVRLTMGDAARPRDSVAIHVQGEVVDTVATDAGQFAVKHYTAEVSEATAGQLAIRLEDTGGVTGRAVINGLVITPAAGGEPVLMLDFGQEGSPVEPGFLEVRASDTYRAEAGYGWHAEAADADQDRGLDFDQSPHANFKLGQQGEHLRLLDPDGSVVFQYAPEYPEQRLGPSYGVQQARTDTTPVVAGSAAQVLVPSVANGGAALGTSWTEVGFDGAGWMSGTTGVGYERGETFAGLIATDLEADMFGTNTTAYVRVPFELEDAFLIYSLALRIKYDDGFVAYLNGQEVARRNAPEGVGWNSQSTRTRLDSESVEFEAIDISSFVSLLEDGPNVLAIHGLNSSDTSDRFLVVPELDVSRGEPIETVSLGYFSTPTPGGPNGVESLSGLVAQPTMDVGRGFFEAAFDVVITSATPGATIVYTTDGSVPSLDGGTQVSPADSLTPPSITLHVDRTMVLKAAAVLSGSVPSPSETHTYIFPADVAAQDFQGTLDAGFPELWGPVAPDYGIDPDVVGPNDRFDGEFAGEFIDALTAVPTLSIVMDSDDLFGAEGIYTNSALSGSQWERPTSVELLYPDGTRGLQVDAGIRIQGGFTRDHGITKKKSFRLVFRSQYGPAKLEFPLFGEAATDRFDTVILRTNGDDGWQWTNAGPQPQYIRDEWMRATQLAMGQVGSHGTFMHLYINGIYWGLYNPVERPEASFSETYFGGDKEEWDVLNAGSPVNGTRGTWDDLADLVRPVDTPDQQASNAAYQRVLGNWPDGTNDPDLETQLDVENYIDYMILNIYSGNTDWPRHNWYAARQRGPESTGFKFYSWDAEWTLNLRSPVTTNQTGVHIQLAHFYDKLRANDEFRLLFADHVQRHFAPGGVFYVDPEHPQWDPAHPERNVPAARYSALADQVELALIGESARWGDQHRENLPYTLREWRAERDVILANYFPHRSAIVLDQFIAAGLFPELPAPQFSQYGGEISEGFELQIGATAGDIYYTVDGTDPRLSSFGREAEEEAVGPTAIQYTGPIDMSGGTVVKARVLVRAGDLNLSGTLDSQDADDLALALRRPDVYHQTHGIAAPVAGDTDGDGDVDFDDIARLNELVADPALADTDLRWSALSEAAFASEGPLPLRITEIMYHPSDPEPGSGFDDDADFEFIELVNISDTSTIELENVAFTDGIAFTFPQRALGPGQQVVVVRNLAAFDERYGNLDAVAGQYGTPGGLKLNNSGETLRLEDATGNVIQEFAYVDTWYPSTDGSGFSLEMVDPHSDDSSLWGQRHGWLASLQRGGTPGMDRPT